MKPNNDLSNNTSNSASNNANSNNGISHSGIPEILEALAGQKQRGETSLIVKLEGHLIEEAMHTLRGYRKLFAAVIPGLTDTSSIYAEYDRMRQEARGQHTILLLVECETKQEFVEALGRLPLRKSSDWRSVSSTEPMHP